MRSKKGDSSTVLMIHEQFVYFRALQGHSGRNPIDPSLQGNAVIPSGFFPVLYHIGCAFNLHSIIISGFILEGQNSSNRQTVFFLFVDPRKQDHKDLEKIDLNVPRRAQNLHNAWKRHQDRCILGRHRSCDQRRIDILSDTIECNYPSRNTSSVLYSKSCEIEDWRSLV